ncbi:MAG: hypothetical protein ACYC69_10480 [Thermodesulfovibrionales bacterium]
MTRTKADGNFASLIYRPLCVLLLLAGLFFMIWLRSSIVTLTYTLRTIEERTSEARKDTKKLMAERAQLMSVSKVTSALQTMAQNKTLKSSDGDMRYMTAGYVIPDRTKVVHVKKSKGPEPYRASLTTGDKN